MKFGFLPCMPNVSNWFNFQTCSTGCVSREISDWAYLHVFITKATEGTGYTSIKRV